MRHSRSHDSIVTDDSSLSTSGSGFSKFSKWVRNAQPGGCATPPVEKGVRIAPKCALKSKVCFVYEKLFEGVDIDETEVGCWQDFWLLKVDEKHLRDCFDLQAELEVENIQVACRSFLAKAKKTACDEAQLPLRRERAFQTLTAFIWGVLSKPNWKNFSVSVLNILCGVYQSQTFFTDLIKSIQSVVERATDAKQASLRYEAIRCLEAIVCGQKNCSINTLIELPASTLPETFYDTVVSNMNPERPSEADFKFLNILAVLISVEQKSNAAAYLKTLKGKSLATLQGVLTYILHNFGKGFAIRNKYSSFKSAGFLSSLTSAAYTYLYTPSNPDIPEEFDPISERYHVVPGSVCSAILLLAELAGNQAHVDGLVRKPSGDARSYFKYLSDVHLQEGKKFVCAPLLLECFLTSSILLQGSRHRLVSISGRSLILMWDRLTTNPTFMHFMYTAEPDAQYVIMEKSLSKWVFVVSGGHRITGARDNPGGAPIGVLLTLVDGFVSVNLAGNFRVASYDAAVSLLNRIYFYQLESKTKVSWDPTHLTEKLLQIVSHLTRSDSTPLDTPQASKLLKSLMTLFRLLLRHPTILPSAQDKAKFIYELVRCRDVVSGLETNIPVHAEQP
eukprot:TRINITY_DN14996_c0_g1_i1.p1 TRINITY_DN14996_c0_g1~~TRINITY_DN14996_c0_g1_i1.p1  ORF type:complete len:618 (+),score=109.19 TRINITY_DN14996_c0_g1_i1:52-1905(+)